MKKLGLFVSLILAFAVPAYAQDSLTNFPNGVSSFGIPQIGIEDILRSGTVVWVDNDGAAATTSNSGQGSFEEPYNSIDYAIDRLGAGAASKGALVLVKEGHIEYVDAAGALDLDLAGVTIRGLGVGRNRPELRYATSTAADIDVDAANIRLENVWIDMTSPDAVIAGIDCNAANFVLKDVEIVQTDATGQALIAFTGDVNCDNLLIDSLKLEADNDGPTEAIIFTAAADSVEIRNSFLHGDFNNSVIRSTAAVTDLNIHDNVVTISDAGEPAIEFTAAATGKIYGNAVASDGTESPVGIDPGSAFAYENYWFDANQTDESAILIPALTQVVDAASNLLGADNANNSAATTLVVANEDGSVLERLEQVQEAVNRGTGTSLPANTSLADFVGKGTATQLATNESLVDVLYGANGVITYPAAAAPANGVSIAEALRYVSDQQVPRFVSKAYADLTGFDTAAAFTVTGDVLVNVVGVVGATQITSTSGTTVLSLGTTEAPQSIIANSTVDGSNFAATDVWVDATPTVDGETLADRKVVIGDGADVILTRSVDDLTAGALTLYCWWQPLSTGASVVAAP